MKAETADHEALREEACTGNADSENELSDREDLGRLKSGQSDTAVCLYGTILMSAVSPFGTLHTPHTRFFHLK